jgi:DNA-binding transcriptional regulator/RsmH inhibitor MraZ
MYENNFESPVGNFIGEKDNEEEITPESEYTLTVDEKSRIRLPASLNEKIQQELAGEEERKVMTVCTAKFLSDREVLKIYLPQSWKIKHDEIQAKIQEKGEDQEKYKRFFRAFCAYTVPTKLDKQGRILIPEMVRDELDLTEEAKVRMAAKGDELYVYKHSEE